MIPRSPCARRPVAVKTKTVATTQIFLFITKPPSSLDLPILTLPAVDRLYTPAAKRSPAERIAEGSQQRSEEHTSELQSQSNLVCRLLLEKKKITKCRTHISKKYTSPTQRSF